MGEVIIVLIKYLGVSAFLWSIYVLLFKGKSSFIAQRIYLIFIPIISIIAATLSINIIEVDESNSFGRMICSANEITESLAVNSEIMVVSQTINSPQSDSHIMNFDVASIFLILTIVISLILIVSYVKGLRKISSIRKLSSVYKQGAVTICRSGLVETPFSFMSSIFIDREIDGEKLDMVLTHEMAHINRLHYIDKVISKIYIIVSWFNPFVWSIQRELDSVHEFEADYTVLRSEFNEKRYKQYIFDELMFSSPILSSGFNNSLTKQRFLQMKNNYKIKNTMLRKALTVPAIVLMLILTSFTYVNEDVIVANTDKTLDNINNKINSVEVVEDKIVPVESDKVVELEEPNVETVDVIDTIATTESDTIKAYTAIVTYNHDSGIIIVDSVDKSITEIKKEIEAKSDEIARMKADLEKQKVELENSSTIFRTKLKPYEPSKVDYNYYYLDKSQYTVNSQRERNIVRIYRYDDHTEVDFAVNVVYKSQWVNFSKNTFLVDPVSLDKYKIHSIKNEVPVDRNLRIEGEKGSQVVVTLIFPPLKRNIRNVNFVEEESDTLIIPPNNAGVHLYKRVKVEKERPQKRVENIITLDSNFEITPK